MSICKSCGKYHKVSDMIIVEGNLYCEDCVVYCDDCGEPVLISNAHTDTRGHVICDSCWNDGCYQRCNDCDEIIHGDYVHWGADCEPYCEDCFFEHFTICDRCGETIYNDDAVWDEDREEYLCQYCYDRSNVIYDYHDFDTDEFIPRYLNDEDRNENYRELYGIELEITGSKSTAGEFQSIMGNDVILMHDGSVDGYEMVSMPMSRKYFYSEFVPLLDKGLKYLRDNEMSGHNGGGIHIHFKTLQRGLEVANMVNILYGTENDIDIWLAISQRRKLAMENWCSMTTLYNSPESIIEDNLLSPNGSCNHGTALNYDDRTDTHELRIFNSNLRLERVIKNMECLFALEDYVKQYTKLDEFNCTTRGYIDFVYHNKTKYPYIYNFMIEKNIFDKAYEYYNDMYAIETGNETVTEV